MAIEVLRCPNCSAPLPAGARGEVVCEYCRHVLTGVPTATGYRWTAGDERPPDDGHPRVHVEGKTFAVLGRLARGDGSDVFLAKRDKRLTEVVVLKVLRASSDADLLANEWKHGEALQESEAQGWEFFRRMTPQPVAHGRMTRDGAAPGMASVFRWRSGFVHTFEDVLRAYPQGVPPTAAVWMWKRALEVLGWVHLAGYVHGAMIPAHLTLHARDHGVALVGWGASTTTRAQRLRARSAAARDYYPDDAWERGVATRATDFIMLARCIARVLGGDAAKGSVPRAVPEPVAELVLEQAGRRTSDRDDETAWELVERVSAAGRAAFGPPRYVSFAMPGWR